MRTRLLVATIAAAGAFASLTGAPAFASGIANQPLLARICSAEFAGSDASYEYTYRASDRSVTCFVQGREISLATQVEWIDLCERAFGSGFYFAYPMNGGVMFSQLVCGSSRPR